MFQKPNKTSSEDKNSAFAVGTVLLTRVKENTFYGPEELSGIETAWLPIRPLSNSEVQALNTAAPGSAHSPFSVFLSVTETEEPSKFMQILAGSLDDNIDSVKTKAKEIVIDLTGLELDSDSVRTGGN